MNISELQRELADELTFLRKYEEQLRYETDPRQQQKLERQIAYTKTVIKGLQVQLKDLGVAVDSEEAQEGKLRHSSLPRQPYFFGREKELVIIAKAILPTTRTWGVLIDGPGGIGKTSLAIRAGDLAPTSDFEYKIFLSAKVRELTATGEQSLDDFKFSSYPSLLTELGHELGEDEVSRLAPEQRAKAVLRILAGIDALIIIDNVETLPEPERIRLYQFLARLPRTCKAIVTSRRRSDIEARIIRLDRLAREDALQLLDKLAENNSRLKKATAAEREDLYTITNGNPLLIRWLVEQLGRSGSRCRTIAEACAFLEKAPKGNDPLEYIFGDLLDTFTDSETSVLTALVHFSQPARVDWIAEVADIPQPAARTALEDLADRALLIADEALGNFFLPPLAATFLRRKHPEAVGQTGGRLTDRAYALAIENGYDKHDRFPILEAEWPTIAAAFPLFIHGANDRLQNICSALRTFLDFAGRWDEKLYLSQEAEAKAISVEDFYKAGWRAFDTGWIHFLREQASETLACATRCAAHWEKFSQDDTRERAVAIRLQGMGYKLEGNYPAAIKAYQESLTLRQVISAESIEVAAVLGDLAGVQKIQGDYDAAEQNYREALRIAKKFNDAENVTIQTGNLAALALDRKEWTDAEMIARDALQLAEKVGKQESIGHQCYRLAKALEQQNKPQEGLAYARRAVEIFTHLRQPGNLKAAQTVLKKCGG